MKLLIPLGLLGLLGIVVLIIIYIIKPNFQQKIISSTYIWQLSRKRRKKKLPTNKLRNILLFICQVLILASMAGILAKPVLMHALEPEETDVIAILDSSASMYAETDGITRYDRAVQMVISLAEKTIDDGGYMSVIVADSTPSFLERRVTLTNKDGLIDELNELLKDENACSYGEADIDGALELTEEILLENPSAEIYLYTDTEYAYVPSGIKVENLAESTEWNVAILDAYAELEDGTYTITVEVACYGSDTRTDVHVDVNNANAYDNNSSGSNFSFEQTVECNSDETKKVIFKYGGGIDSEDLTYFAIGDDQKIYSYQSVHIYIDEADSFVVDNSFDIYGGQREVLKVQYASSLSNNFFNDALLTLSSTFSDLGLWDLQVTDVKQGTDPALEGFDFYIFEHEMPEKLPTDGVVFFVDPDIAPSDSGFKISGTENLKSSVYLLAEENTAAQAILNYLSVDLISVYKYTKITCDSSYETLMTCNGDPVFIVQNDGNRQIAVMPFSLHYSNLALLPEFTFLLYNMFSYFLPSTTSDYAFAVGEAFSVNARGSQLDVYYSGTQIDSVTTFPATLSFTTPGTYTLSQYTYFDVDQQNQLQTNIFVKIPSSESNIRKTEDGLTEPVRVEDEGVTYDDLLLYLAAALVFLLFAEWLLHTRESI